MKFYIVEFKSGDKFFVVAPWHDKAVKEIQERYPEQSAFADSEVQEVTEMHQGDFRQSAILMSDRSN